ncbi:MAG: glycosyltransferase family A protein [bacterium]
MNPLISIILPTHNGARTIGRAVASVSRQTYPAWELLIVNDGSTDDTWAVIEELSHGDPRIVLISHADNRGIQKSLNQGVSRAKGKYMARIDDDDEWIDPSKLVAQAGYLEEHPDHVLLGTDAVVVDEKGTVLSANTMPKADTAIRAKILSKNCFLHSTVVMRADAVKKSGGYSESAQTLHAEDYELWLRLGGMGKMANLSMHSTALTARTGSLTASHRVAQAKHVLGAVLAHRREYPNFLQGYATGIARLIFFWLLPASPMQTSVWYSIQRWYRSF